METSSFENYAYYYSLRAASRNAVADSINRKTRTLAGMQRWGNITLCSIEEDALKESRTEWPKFYGNDTHTGFAYSWEKLYHRFMHRPSFFDLAVWQHIGGEKVLQALALGRPSHGKTHLTLNWVERSFAPTYLRGGALVIILACAEEYAKLLGCQRVLIHEPVDPMKYERYEYRPYKIARVPARYLCKEL